ncbi:endonuclease/exonuclease/phosphatase family protein [uncultured Bacteroides sp.]|uniref:endonuclease/exonuclease/phosphatase family protein n=1 Tax=uncultured Bacteroides sp. TaxID=162156 RepID=UPI002AAB1C06|nr:endonuclease/exonuclease/phosphatase family protein [uncultured Bacteroides sp.]
MKKFIAFVSFITILSTISIAKEKPYKVVFYNLENFFDTINDPEIHDDEFTPEGPKEWTTAKYNKKLNNIERVFFDIASIDKNYPIVIGVSEVENRGVLEDIVATPKLAPANYRIAHFDSPDARGIDVAFLYRPDVFKIEGKRPVKANVPSIPDFRTRDILTMWGTIQNEPFFFMVAHWPSRLGGKEASEFKRIAIAKQMRNIADSVMQVNPATKIIAMGDFNDDPTDQSISEGLQAKFKLKNLTPKDLYDPYADMLKAGYGTLAYNDAWNIFDNIVVSGNLAKASAGTFKLEKASGSKFYGNIFKQHYMVQKEGRYKGYPLRTYVGNNFQGGFSDHFPVYIYIGK